MCHWKATSVTHDMVVNKSWLDEEPGYGIALHAMSLGSNTHAI